MKTVLHVRIPGEPHVQERHRWGQNNNYDPSAKDKKAFQWELKAAAPTLPDHHLEHEETREETEDREASFPDRLGQLWKILFRRNEWNRLRRRFANH
jgi:hypothetical protein